VRAQAGRVQRLATEISTGSINGVSTGSINEMVGDSYLPRVRILWSSALVMILVNFVVGLVLLVRAMRRRAS